ncbi:MAG TPA: ABC transporter permease, partial [Pyrinomonadaceae bacterium]|nr:ABC transporter permease [Pyrinomonadaceae bacterium]
MSNFWQDLRLALRGMWKQPGFTVIAVVTLALGIGSNTAIFSVINALILNASNFVEPESVVALWRTSEKNPTKNSVSYIDLKDLRAQSRSFESIAAYKMNGFTLLHQDQAERVQGMRVTANFLSTLKVHPMLGRDFQVEEEKPNSTDVVIISHQFWNNRLAGDPNVIGTPLTIDGKPFTIIGILPSNFEFPLARQSTEVLTTVAAEDDNLTERGAHVFLSVGRLVPGVTAIQAEADLTNVAANLEREYPQHWRNIHVSVVPADEEIVAPQMRRGLWVLLGAVVFLLLIACTNVSNLLLVRATVRQREVALRLALGAGRWRIVRQWLTESLLLSLLSAGAGMLLAFWVLKAIKYFGTGQLPRIHEVRMDVSVLIFTVGVSMLVVPLFSLLPV